MSVLGLRQLGDAQPGNLTNSAGFTPPLGIRQHATDEREADTVLVEEPGCGPRPQFDSHGQGLVDGAGKFGVRTVHAVIMPLTHSTPLMLINVQADP